ncbi:MAG: V-type ATP synthase subunit F [bacterium]|nr:V-type ATP synthase subunit F [bacterium]
MEHKLAIIGPKKIVSVFKATGADIFEAEDAGNAVLIIRDIKKKMESGEDGSPKYAVVVIIEKLLREIREEDYEKISRGALPAIVAIPGLEGSSGEAIEKLKKLAERAVGMAIIK